MHRAGHKSGLLLHFFLFITVNVGVKNKNVFLGPNCHDNVGVKIPKSTILFG